MTSPTGFAGRLRPVVPAAKKGTPTSRVGLRRPSSFACQIKDHLSCLAVFCRCDCHEEKR